MSRESKKKENPGVVRRAQAKAGDNFGKDGGMRRMEKFLQHENSLFLIKNWYRDGYSFQEMADKIGVTLQIFKEARNEFEEFDKALMESKDVVDYKVENALLKSALGYTTKEVKVTTTMRYGKVVETVKEVTEKEFAPNVSAIQMWLYNRQKDKWRNMNVQKSLTEDLEEDSSIEITVKRASDKESKDTGVQPAEFEADEKTNESESEIDEKEITVRKKSKKQVEEEKKKKQKELAETNEEDWSEVDDEDWEGVDD